MNNWFEFFKLEEIDEIGKKVENDKRLHSTNTFCNDFLISNSNIITLALLEMFKVISLNNNKKELLISFNSLTSKMTKQELANTFSYLDHYIINILFNALNLISTYDDEKRREEIQKSSQEIREYLNRETLVEMKNSIAALEVSKYVLAKSQRALKVTELEQILYLIQINFLEKGYLLFSDDIEKTDNGIEIKSLRDYYKIYGNYPITMLLNRHKESLNIPVYYLDELNNILAVLINLNKEERENLIINSQAYTASDKGVISLLTMIDSLKNKGRIISR